MDQAFTISGGTAVKYAMRLVFHPGLELSFDGSYGSPQNGQCDAIMPGGLLRSRRGTFSLSTHSHFTVTCALKSGMMNE
jgi:hypothetical protein